MANEREKMDMHREYMKRYQQQASHLTPETVRYKDHYAALGIPRSATHAEIRAAYRKLALKFHPDRNPSKEAEERWDGVPAAYAVLSNPNDRSHYDASLETRDALVLFYSTYNPAKLDQCTIQAVIDGWHGREVELFRMLSDKYEIAAHSGTKSANDLTDMLNMPEEKAVAISKDSVASAPLPPTSYSLWEGLRYLSQGVCCAAKKSYYEVNSQSPGFIDLTRNTNTPGTAPHTTAETEFPDKDRPKTSAASSPETASSTSSSHSDAVPGPVLPDAPTEGAFATAV
ncbi:hypothetical protein SPRG_15941 [Saprolegnia parasitica CBS 223.65]|uniref:J domain-containing protein n=1 Tax=Saprolegnia parasitica (strain CBS 223.65) TaxID=695850 RepID=A0A067BKQ2_SAPPC|nr:hypothetical protein SPRG_15941 [Saprolegnia parasitica CBS 223.65]KDO18753.1 hypothetical protein SPRG_15941 [Saprolegnia parasitica CBS 223.65]|eukprot:XP_012210531.1 hypothetical protein SPRG_15941 [Saprolegnia parasitica CBS 223.65]